jgi:hypothetical protein
MQERNAKLVALVAVLSAAVLAIGTELASASGTSTGREIHLYEAQAVPAAATGNIYWVGRVLQNNGDFSFYVGRSQLGGSRTNPTFIHLGSVPGSAPGSYGFGGIAVDRDHLFWGYGNARGYGLARANLNGSALNGQFLSAGRFGYPLRGVAVDALHVYFVDYSQSSGETTIARASVDGSGLKAAFISLPQWQQNQPVLLAVSPHDIYWLTTNSIGRANLDGTGATDPYIRLPGFTYARGFAFDGSHLYWTLDHSIARINADGSGLNTRFITGLNLPGSLEVFGPHIYWAQNGTIRSADLNGSHVATLVRLSIRTYVQALALNSH